ncbi:MAG: NFACT family protein, partial [Fusobacteriaceae bacterium]|nr:NFACT family protein [Fusobacteriaceae bacterium]
MFYLDGISLSKLREELNRQLAGKKLSKISKNTDLSLSLHFGKRELVFSCDNAFPIVYVTDKKEEALSLSSGLTDTLRKCLTGGQLMAVEQRGFDRILIFSFSRLNELGEEKNYRIYFELIGKRSNFILTDEKGIILDLLRRYSLEENRSRTLFPGVPYEMPTPSGKISPAELTPGKFCALRRESPRPGCSFLTDCVEGVGKILAANVKNYEDFVRIRDGAAKPAAFYEGDAITLAAVLPVEPPDYTSRRSFESCQALINHYVENEKLSRGFVVLKRYLLTLTEKKIKKDRRILEILEKEKEEAGKQEQYKEWGDILAANLFRAEKGMQQLRARDFYHDRDVEIPLDPRLSPNENLDRLYKKYNKGKRTLKANRLRALEIGEDLEY